MSTPRACSPSSTPWRRRRTSSSHSLMVLRTGTWSPRAGGRRTRPTASQLLYSLSKSFTSTALGLAVAEGLVVARRHRAQPLPGARRRRHRPAGPPAAGPARRGDGQRARVRDRRPARATDPRDLVRGFLLTPPEQEPGSVFAYNQPCTYVLARDRRPSRPGQSLTEYLRPRLLEPLGHLRRRLDAGRLGTRPGVLRVCTPRPTRSPGSACCTCGRGVWEGAGCCRRSGSPRRRGRTSATTTPAPPAGLVAGLRLPVLAVPARLPRRRRLRAVLPRAARGGRRRGDDGGDRGHGFRARRRLGPPAARAGRLRRLRRLERGWLGRLGRRGRLRGGGRGARGAPDRAGAADRDRRGRAGGVRRRPVGRAGPARPPRDRWRR